MAFTNEKNRKVLNKGSFCITNASRGTVNAWRFQSQLAVVVTVVVFKFSVMRCQPLRRALAS
ncbi:acetyltransferase [Vibrio cholerae]|uniref:Acetyltransferase n=1 Tax=Vibrio cholerae TaxID=666 RepID=A0A8B5ZMM1_VIBCL|nr:acetyltransferase [Vibrio cholerae]